MPETRCDRFSSVLRRLNSAVPAAGWLFVMVCCLPTVGCTPFDFSSAKAIAIDKDRLQKLAEEGRGDHLYYAGSDYEYHYVVDTRPDHGQAYKIEPKQLKLIDTFPRGEDEPYVVYSHVIEGKKLGGKPREIPGVVFDDQPAGRFP